MPDRPPPLGAAPVTVAIATFNRAPLLRRALESCREQTVLPQRVIVVDDGSTDDTTQVVEAFEGLALDYLNVGKVGLGRARNLATERCTTPWLCIHDDDDIMLPNRLADHVAGLSCGANMSHGGWINFNERGELDYHPGKQIDEDVILYAGNAITHGACCYETAVLRQFPYRTDVVGGADFDMAVRAVRSGVRCAHTGSYVLLRRRHSHSMSAQAGESQAATRRAVVAAINVTRSAEEIASRTETARRVLEIDGDPPLVVDLHRIINVVPGSMRVAAWVPRAAGPLFDLLAMLRGAGHAIELFDPDRDLGGRLVLSSPPEMDGRELDALDAALRAAGLKSRILVADAPVFGAPPPAEMEVETEPGSFRALLRSDSLRELQLAHRILRSQRRWEWYLILHVLRRDDGDATVFALVSAPFRGVAEGNRSQDGARAEVRRFIATETDLIPAFLDGEPNPCRRKEDR